jgi:hypothetical protein
MKEIRIELQIGTGMMMRGGREGFQSTRRRTRRSIPISWRPASKLSFQLITRGSDWSPNSRSIHHIIYIIYCKCIDGLESFSCQFFWIRDWSGCHWPKNTLTTNIFDSGDTRCSDWLARPAVLNQKRLIDKTHPLHVTIRPRVIGILRVFIMFVW